MRLAHCLDGDNIVIEIEFSSILMYLHVVVHTDV